MRYASALRAAVCCLAGLLAEAPAKADSIFNFSFGLTAPFCSGGSPTCAFGTFTTGAAAPDPGFDLITSLTFSVLRGMDSNGVPFSFTNLAGEDFLPGAAFNPTTDAFINSVGDPPDNIGMFQVFDMGVSILEIEGPSFVQSSDSLSGFFPPFQEGEPDPFAIDGALAISPGIGSTPIPEASTWAMLLLAFGGLGHAVRRRRLGAVLWPKLEGFPFSPKS
jgi:hypothetical protein